MWEVTSTGSLRHEGSNEPLLTDGKYVRGLSGMTLVLPAWCIQEVLDMPILKKLRENAEDRRETIFECEGYPLRQPINGGLHRAWSPTLPLPAQIPLAKRISARRISVARIEMGIALLYLSYQLDRGGPRRCHAAARTSILTCEPRPRR